MDAVADFKGVIKNAIGIWHQWALTLQETEEEEAFLQSSDAGPCAANSGVLQIGKVVQEVGTAYTVTLLATFSLILND